ncbi:DUF3006 domain-containing protein [Desulfosporosinus meridiei]
MILAKTYKESAGISHIRSEAAMYIIDRFEGEWAVIETDNRVMFNFPRSGLPLDLKEGDVINIQIHINPEATLRRHQKAESLLNNFFDE